MLNNLHFYVVSGFLRNWGKALQCIASSTENIKELSEKSHGTVYEAFFVVLLLEKTFMKFYLLQAQYPRK